MLRSSVYVSGLTVACALFYFGAATPAGAVDGPLVCYNMSVPIHIDGPNATRVSSTQKGSLVIFSKVEIKWDASGNLTQDTILDLTNDYPSDVFVQGYFINGDISVDEVRDDTGALVTQFEPGWNTADCRFELTGNQPTYWSAARGGRNCQAFTVLDPQGPGRLNSDGLNGERILRGYAVFWAVKFDRTEGPTGSWVEINWNHLKGDAVIVNYANGSAWEYNGWSFKATVASRGGALGSPGVLLIGSEYEAAYDQLIFDFYATGTNALSNPGPTCSGGANAGQACGGFNASDCPGGTCNVSADVTVQLDTDITLHPVDLDLRQDGCGPILTKAVVDVWTEFESKFSATRRCICCWDSVRISLWEGINYFTRSVLGTDKGKARIDGSSTNVANCEYADVCGIDPYQRKFGAQCRQICSIGECPGPGCADWNLDGFAEASPLLGVAVKRLAFSPTGDFDMAGMNLHGTGRQHAVIWTDLEAGPSEARKGSMSRSTR